MKDKLLQIISKFQNTEIFVIGDIILDSYIWGGVDRVSPEAPVVIVEVKKEEERLGGAGNVAANLSELGAKVHLCGVVGNDFAGQKLVGILAEKKINPEFIVFDETRPTTQKTRVIATHQQIVRIDKESSDSINPLVTEKIGNIITTQYSKHSGVILSDYAKGVFNKTISGVLENQYLANRQIPFIIDPKERNFGIYPKATVVKPNRKEAEIAAQRKITSTESAIVAGRELMQKWQSDKVLITLGELGMVLINKQEQTVEGLPMTEETTVIPTKAREVFDVSGAGDTVSAVLALAMAVNAPVNLAAELANLAAGVVVGEVGTAPITLSQLIKACEEN